MPAAKKPDDRQFEVGDKIRVNLHHDKIEDAVIRAVIQGDDGVKLQVDVVGLDLTALIDTRQVVDDLECDEAEFTRGRVPTLTAAIKCGLSTEHFVLTSDP